MKNDSEKTMNKIIEDLATNRAKVLDDFAKVYLASRWEDYFSKQKQIDFRRLEMVEERTDTGFKWYFQLKKGNLKKIENLSAANLGKKSKKTKNMGKEVEKLVDNRAFCN